MTTSVTRLKELLFDAEAQRLEDVQRRLETMAATETARHSEVLDRQNELQRRLDTVFDRTGTEDRLQKSVATIIDGALRDAEVTKHEQLSQAMAPLVVQTIKFELKNNQKAMVDALYPLTGQLVQQYVAAAMAKIAADVNAKLGGGGGKVIPSEFQKRADAIGVPVSDLILTETQELKVDELFLVRRGSGDLVAHWERDPIGGPGARVEQSNRDVLIAGYLTGITAFSEEAFDEKKSTLRSLDMGTSRVFVRASPAYLLAARCSGSAPGAVEQVINDEFVRVVGEYRDALSQAPQPGKPDNAAVDAVLPNLAASFERRFGEERAKIEKKAEPVVVPPSFARLYAMAAAVLLPLLAFGAWLTWQSWETSRVHAAAKAVVASNADLRGYPIQFDVERGGKSLVVAGLMPRPDTREALLKSLKTALPQTVVQDGMGLLPQAGVDMTPDIIALRRELAAAREQTTTTDRRVTELAQVGPQLSSQLSNLQGQLPPLQKQDADLQAAIQKLNARINALPAPIAPVASTPREELETFMRGQAVFFYNGSEFLDEQRASITLDQLAVLINKADTVVRVIGYTDERGTAQTNAAIAQARADRVVQLLVERGVPSDRLISLGRIGATDLSRYSGAGSPNRRVAFEIGYVGEPTTR